VDASLGSSKSKGLFSAVMLLLLLTVDDSSSAMVVLYLAETFPVGLIDRAPSRNCDGMTKFHFNGSIVVSAWLVFTVISRRPSHAGQTIVIVVAITFTYITKMSCLLP
jgi:hypothetical protein